MIVINDAFWGTDALIVSDVKCLCHWLDLLPSRLILVQIDLLCGSWLDTFENLNHSICVCSNLIWIFHSCMVQWNKFVDQVEMLLRFDFELCALRDLLVGQVCRLDLYLLIWVVVMRSTKVLLVYLLIGAVIVIFILVVQGILNRRRPAIFTSIRGVAFELLPNMLGCFGFFGNVVFAEATRDISSFIDPGSRVLIV